MTDSHIESLYQEAKSALKARDYEYAIELLKRVLVVDENYKDTSRLLEKAIRLRKLRWYKNPILWGALGLVIIFVLGFTIASKIGGLFSSSVPTETFSPTATRTSAPTKTSIPSATPTQAAVAPPTSTAASSPIETVPLVPAWVTDFAQPILDTIDGRTPNTQENFDLGIPNWVKLYHSGNDCLKVVNGEMIDRCLSYWTMWYTDYVVEMNIRFISASESNRWEFYFRNFGEGFYFYPDGPVWANIEGGGSYELSSWGSNYRKVLIIVHDQFAAVFVDDQSLLSIDLELRWKNGTAYWGGAPVAFDYIKIWDLNSIKNSP
jgi:hypothetical protein